MADRYVLTVKTRKVRSLMDIKFDKAKWQQDSDNALWLMLKVCKDNYNAVKRFVGINKG